MYIYVCRYENEREIGLQAAHVTQGHLMPVALVSIA